MFYGLYNCRQKKLPPRETTPCSNCSTRQKRGTQRKLRSESNVLVGKMMQLRARRCSSDAAQRDRREARLEPVQGSPQEGGRGGELLPGRREPLLQAAAPAQCGVMRAAATHTPSPTFTTSSSSALQIANCTLQFPEDRTSWRRHRTLHEDPVDDQGDHQGPRPQDQELPSSEPRSWMCRPSMIQQW